MAYPKASVAVAQAKRKGSFEVSLNGNVIFSKLDSFGPTKDRAALPVPKELVLTTISQHLTSEKPHNPPKAPKSGEKIGRKKAIVSESQTSQASSSSSSSSSSSTSARALRKKPVTKKN
ncbi:MAG: hypothetical protein Q8P67_03080 [archaeon]|nr:hypothetical protein [archaeon]